MVECALIVLIQFPLQSLLLIELQGITAVETKHGGTQFTTCCCLTGMMDADDAIIMSDPEISTEDNQLAATLVLKLRTVLVSLNANAKLATEISSEGNPLSGCR